MLYDWFFRKNALYFVESRLNFIITDGTKMFTELEKAAADISNMIARAGGRAILVGGCVRDRLLQREVTDFDLEIYHLSLDKIRSIIEKKYPLDLVGASFGVMKLRHLNIDIALPRLENKTGYGHRGFMVQSDQNLSFAQASARRDFTVNAMMFDPLSGELIDPWNGKSDLEKGILRHVSPHFSEDPLRVLRGMQFAGRFGFSFAEETVALCAELSQEELSGERIAGEWEKLLLQGGKPSLGLRFLRECNWIRFYPELAALIGCPQNPQWHPEGDVWEHTLRTLDAAAALRKNCRDDDLVLMLAALCHDFGKADCTVIEPDGRITSCGHDTLLDGTYSFIKRYWNKNSLPDAVATLVSHHMHPWQLIRNSSSDKAYRKLALAVKRMDLLADLVESDVRGIGGGEEVLQKKLTMLEKFREHTIKLSLESAPPEPLIKGRHLLERGIPPGREMGELLRRCFAAQIDGEFSDIESGLLYLERILCGK